MEKFDLISPLDYRYLKGDLRKRTALFLSENARVGYQASVEAALAKVLAKKGVCSRKVAKEIEKAARRVKAAQVYKEEEKIKHDVRALANVIRSKVSKEARPFVHFSATSYDIVDTANALRYKDATEQLVIPALKDLEKIWIRIALKEKRTLQIGRTHGQHSEPITFGFAVAGYVSRLGDRIKAIENAKNNLCGKFSGAVGAYNASSLLIKSPQDLEKQIMKQLGLKLATHSTQIVEPESLLDLQHSLISAFCVLANFADDMRNLQRSEINEIAESFGKKQVGSSTMPHKRNPINFENVKSLWKEFMPRMSTFYLDSISDHQRDLTNSASARFIPELFIGLLVSAERLNRVCSGMVVDKVSMKKNFNMASELIIAEPLYILLAKYRHENAHEIVRKLTLEAGKGKKGLLELAYNKPELNKYLTQFSKKEIALLRNPEKYVGLSVAKTEQVCRYWKKELKL